MVRRVARKDDAVNDLVSLNKMRDQFLQRRAQLENPNLSNEEAAKIEADIIALLHDIPVEKRLRVSDALWIGHRAELIHDILHGTNLWNEHMRPA
jgi:hypothetical protein